MSDPLKDGANGNRPTNVPDVPQATNSIAKIVIVVGLALAAFLAAAAVFVLSGLKS